MMKTKAIEENIDSFLNVQQKEFIDRYKLFDPESIKTYKDFAYYVGENPFELYIRKVAINQRMSVILPIIDEKKESISILDAGCGIGTESLLFATLGAKTIGIDIIQERLNLAEQRQCYYESELGRKLPAEFHNKNIFRFLEESMLDIIWLREAISHIHPIERFFELTLKALNNNGYIVINDANWSNPRIKYQLIREYWKHYKFFSNLGESSIYYVKNVKDPETNQDVEFAMERVFSLKKTCRMLEKVGFKIIRAETVGFIPKGTITNFITKNDRRKIIVYGKLAKLEGFFNYIPIFKNIGLSNHIVAKKKA